VATIGTSVTPGTGAAHLGKAEDAAHASGDTGVMALAVRSNTAASTGGTDGDYQPLITNTTGHLWVDASGQTLTVGTHAVTQSGTWNVGTVTTLTGITNVVHVDDNAGSLTVDAPVGTPVFVRLSDGASAITTLPVSISGNQAVNVAQVGGSNVSTAAAGVQKVGLVGNAGATVDSTVGAGAAPTNQVVVGSVYSATAPAPTAGQAMAQQADQAGNLRVAPGVALAALSAWNSGTALNATQTVFTNSGCPAVLVQLVQTTTLTAGAVTAEVTYDGTNWVTIPADCVIDPTSTTLATVGLPYTVQASTNKPLLLLTRGAQGLRLKLSTQITGTGTVTPNYALLPYPAVQQTVLGAGSATVGTVNAAQSGTWNVGTVTTLTSLSQFNGNAISTGNGVSGTGVLRVTIASDSTGQVALAAGSATIGALTANQTVDLNRVAGTATATGNGTASAGCQRVTVASDNTAFPVNATLQAGSNLAGRVNPEPQTANGLSISRTLSAANTTGISVKGSAGQVYTIVAINTNAAARFLKLYNKATAPTVGTDTPVMTIPIPGNTAGAGVVLDTGGMGIAFGTGIGIGITTGVADADTGAPAANEVVVNVLYK
jgi:hypothetical protein